MSDEEMDWDKAKGHFDAVCAEYRALRYVSEPHKEYVIELALQPLAVRYGRGERSRDLYDAMLAVE